MTGNLATCAAYAEAAYENKATFCAMVGAEPEDVEFIEYTIGDLDVQAYTHKRYEDETLIIAVRGSETAKWDDWLNNLRFAGKRLPGGSVHRGFYGEASAIATNVARAVRECPGWEVLATGHSKGGAIVTLLQHLYGLEATAHTFGEPRSLGARARGEFQHSGHSHVRWVNTTDPVPKLLWWRYRHAGLLVYLDRDGNWNRGYASPWDMLAVFLRNPFGGVPRHSMSAYRALIDGGLAKLKVNKN
jgi:hypothetical protein